MFVKLLKVINNPHNNKFFNNILKDPENKKIFNNTINNQYFKTNGSLTKLMYILDQKGHYKKTEFIRYFGLNLAIVKQQVVISAEKYDNHLNTIEKWVPKIYLKHKDTSYDIIFNPNGILDFLKNSKHERENNLSIEIENIIMNEEIQGTDKRRKKQIL